MGVRLRAAIVLIAAGCTSEDPAPGDRSGFRQPGLTFGPVNLDQFCERRAEAECHRLEVCSPRRLASIHGSIELCRADRSIECERGFIELTAQVVVDLGLVRIDPDKMGAGLSEYSRRHCATTAGAPSPLFGAIGLIGDGEPCNASAVCVSGFCNNGGGGCGRCAMRPANQPRACPSACAIGEGCRCNTPDGGARDCACAPALQPGDDCAAAREHCDEGSRCLDYVDQDEVAHTRCVPIPFEGEPCGASTGFTECVGDAYCAFSGDSGGCVAPRVVASGDACDTLANLCPVDHDCRGRCVRRALTGAMCTSQQQPIIPDAGPPTCSDGLCAGGVCQPLGNQGAFCLRSIDCAETLGCDRAVLFGGGTCTSSTSMRDRVRAAFNCR